MPTLRWYDPHSDDFCAKNLNEDFYRECQRSVEVQDLAEKCITTFAANKALIFQKYELDNMAHTVMMDAGLPHHILMGQKGHWLALAICMMTHGRMYHKILGEIHVELSPFGVEPMYWNNVTYERIPGKTWEGIVRKKHEDKDSRPAGNRKDDETHGAIRAGNSERDTGQQNLFSNLY